MMHRRSSIITRKRLVICALLLIGLVLLLDWLLLSDSTTPKRPIRGRESIRTEGARHEPSSTSTSTTSTTSRGLDYPIDAALNNVVFIFKTGYDVVHRVPAAWHAYLKYVPHIFVSSDYDADIEIASPNKYTILRMHNVLQYLPFKLELPLRLSPTRWSYHAASDADAIALSSMQPRVNTKQIDGDVIKPDSTTTGYRHDQLKFIPSIRRAAELHPDASWFFLVDDDTFVFLNNLADYIKSLDPTRVQYDGFVFALAGVPLCFPNNVVLPNSAFVHAGAGILISRATVNVRCIIVYVLLQTIPCSCYTPTLLSLSLSLSLTLSINICSIYCHTWICV